MTFEKRLLCKSTAERVLMKTVLDPPPPFGGNGGGGDGGDDVGGSSGGDGKGASVVVFCDEALFEEAPVEEEATYEDEPVVVLDALLPLLLCD